MAVFSSGNTDRSQDPSSRSAGREGDLSIIAPGMRVVGELGTSGVIKVEGQVEGSIRADREVLVAKGGHIEGDVYTRAALIGGHVTGSIFADERVEVQQSATVQGDISTKKLIVQEGGEVNGRVKMGEPRALEQASAIAKAPESAKAGSPVS